jgi:hypoxanthine phosphoribosyltransferase
MHAPPRQREGVEHIAWDRFEALVQQLALQLEAYEPQLILGLVRGGLVPATMVSYMLRRELYPIRIMRRYDTPAGQGAWLVRPPDKVRGRRVIVVDERADSGQTLALAADEVRRMGASHVRTAVLYAHTWTEPRPDYVCLTRDALMISPWDREVVVNGQFVTQPELASALRDRQPVPPEKED